MFDKKELLKRIKSLRKLRGTATDQEWVEGKIKQAKDRLKEQFDYDVDREIKHL